MEQVDRNRFVSSLSGMAEYYGQEISKVVIGFWWDAMNPYQIDEFEQAIQSHIRNPENGQFMPKIADIVRQIDGKARDRAQDAWTKVIDGIRRVGPYQSVVFDDPRIHKIIDGMGGWPLLCSYDLENMPFRQREFCDRYEAIASKHFSKIEYPAQLSGEHDTYNNANGFLEHIRPPAMIGNESECKKVIEYGSKTKQAITFAGHVKAIAHKPEGQ